MQAKGNYICSANSESTWGGDIPDGTGWYILAQEASAKVGNMESLCCHGYCPNWAEIKILFVIQTYDSQHIFVYVET